MSNGARPTLLSIEVGGDVQQAYPTQPIPNVVVGPNANPSMTPNTISGPNATSPNTTTAPNATTPNTITNPTSPPIVHPQSMLTVVDSMEEVDALLQKYRQSVPTPPTTSFPPTQTTSQSSTPQTPQVPQTSTPEPSSFPAPDNTSRFILYGDQIQQEKRRWITYLFCAYGTFVDHTLSEARKLSAICLPPSLLPYMPAKESSAHCSPDLVLSLDWYRAQNESKAKAEAWLRDLSRLDAMIRDKSRTTIPSDAHLTHQWLVSYYKHLQTLLSHYKAHHQLQNVLHEKYITLLRKVGESYDLYYSWLMSEWQRSMKDMEKSVDAVRKKVMAVFATKDPAYRNIEQMLTRYQTFLQTYDQYLPLELSLTHHSREDWKTFLLQNRPIELLHLMKTELKAMENVPALQTHITMWRSLLDAFDLQKLQQMADQREQLKHKMMTAIELETTDACARKWNEFQTRVLNMSIQLQEEAQAKMKKLQSLALTKLQALQSNIDAAQYHLTHYTKQGSEMAHQAFDLVQSIQFYHSMIRDYHQTAMESEDLNHVIQVAAVTREFIEKHKTPEKNEQVKQSEK